MSQIHFFTPAQEALIPDYQEKWRQIYCSIEPIDPNRAEAAVKELYAVMGQKEPDIVFCASPHAALDYLQAYISSQNNVRLSQKKIRRNTFQSFIKSPWKTIELIPNHKHAKTKLIDSLLIDILGNVSRKISKLLAKHIARCLPRHLTTQDILEQSEFSASSLFDTLEKQRDRREKSDFSRESQDMSPEEKAESFRETAFAIETQLAWLPAKRFFFRCWLRHFLLGVLPAKVCGTEHPRFEDTIYASLSLSERELFSKNPAVIISNVAIECIWLDFAFSVLNYPHPTKKWSALQAIVKHCGWIFAVDNICVICDRPTKILLNDDNQLHRESKPVLEFSDGFVAYAYHNVPLPEKYGTVHPDQWQSQWVLEEKIPECRQLLIHKIGAVRLCQELPVVNLDAMQEYSLLKLEHVDFRDKYILKRIDPETGNIHAVFVPWNIGSVWSAIQYANQNFSPEDFPIPAF